jgi:hypothetical protein
MVEVRGAGVVNNTFVSAIIAIRLSRTFFTNISDNAKERKTPPK